MSKYRIKLDGKVYEMEIERIDDDQIPSSNKQSLNSEPLRTGATQEKQPRPAPTVGTEHMSSNTVTSPMPGTITKVNLNAGDTVKKGQSVLILEAMKMENDIVAPRDGKIASFYVTQGDSVQGGTKLFDLDE